MLFRIGNIVCSRTTFTPTICKSQVDEYIAQEIRKQINGAHSSNVLSYSKSLAACLFKYNTRLQNPLHIFDCGQAFGHSAFGRKNYTAPIRR